MWSNSDPYTKVQILSGKELDDAVDDLLEDWSHESVYFNVYNGHTTLLRTDRLKLENYRPRFPRTECGWLWLYYHLVIHDGKNVFSSIHVAEGQRFGQDKIKEAFKLSLEKKKTALLLPLHVDPDMTIRLEPDLLFQTKMPDRHSI